MKLVSDELYEQRNFGTAKSAKLFAYQHGVEQDFLANPEYSEIKGPVILYGHPDFSSLSSFIIVYSHSHEIGLWVRPDLRNQGKGSMFFKKIIETSMYTKLNYRMFARIDATKSEEAQAMRIILTNTGFNQITIENCSNLELWAH